MSEPILNLDFSAVLEFLRDGNNIAWRQIWKNTYIYVKKTEFGIIMLKHNSIDNNKIVFPPLFEDIFASDWNVQMYDRDEETVTEVVFDELIAEPHEPKFLELHSLDGSIEKIEIPDDTVLEEISEETLDNLYEEIILEKISEDPIPEELPQIPEARIIKIGEETEEEPEGRL